MIPLLSQIPLDSSLFKKDTSHMGPPDSSDRMDTSENGESSKENVDPLLQDLQVTKLFLPEQFVNIFPIPGPGV